MSRNRRQAAPALRHGIGFHPMTLDSHCKTMKLPQNKTQLDNRENMFVCCLGCRQKHLLCKVGSFLCEDKHLPAVFLILQSEIRACRIWHARGGHCAEAEEAALPLRTHRFSGSLVALLFCRRGCSSSSCRLHASGVQLHSCSQIRLLGAFVTKPPEDYALAPWQLLIENFQTAHASISAATLHKLLHTSINSLIEKIRMRKITCLFEEIIPDDVAMNIF